jgi:Polysaccharide lyase
MFTGRMIAAFTYPRTPLQAADVRHRSPKVVGTAITVIAALIVLSCQSASPAISSAPRLFTGDFCTGDFSQWPQIANKDWTGDASAYIHQTYPAQVIREDKGCGYAARFEVRTGDIPAFGGGERSEVFAPTEAGVHAADGETVWYAFSIKFDESFPSDHASLGWGTVIQWHDSTDPASVWPPVVEMGWAASGYGPGEKTDGLWWLSQSPQSTPGVYDFPVGGQRILTLPLDRGEWHDFKMQMKVSADPAEGFIRLWHNGVAQTFSGVRGGSTTFTGATMVPTAPGVKVQLGYYRQNGIVPTGTVYHAGFRMADSEASL